MLSLGTSLTSSIFFLASISHFPESSPVSPLPPFSFLPSWRWVCSFHYVDNVWSIYNLCNSHKGEIIPSTIVKLVKLWVLRQYSNLGESPDNPARALGFPAKTSRHLSPFQTSHRFGYLRVSRQRPEHSHPFRWELWQKLELESSRPLYQRSRYPSPGSNMLKWLQPKISGDLFKKTMP